MALRKRRPQPRAEEDQPRPAFVTPELLDARLESLKNEMKWLRYLIGLVAAAVASPKLGGPEAADLTATVIRHLT